MASVCKRQPTIRRIPQDASGTVRVELYAGTTAFTLRVVDASGTPIAFTAARDSDRTSPFHFAAGEAWTEERLVMDQDLALAVASAAGSVELIAWEG